MTKQNKCVKYRQNDEIEDMEMTQRDDFMQGGAVKPISGPKPCTAERVSPALIKAIDRGFFPLAKGGNDNVSPNKRILNQYINPLSPNINVQRGVEL